MTVPLCGAPWRVSGERHWLHDVGTPAPAIHSQPAPERVRAALFHIVGGMFGDQ